MTREGYLTREGYVTALEGSRILIVGASSGIGREVGIQAAQAGASVAFAARRVDRLDEAVATAGGKSFAFPLDVRDDEQCAGAVTAAVRRFGGLDAVVYATGRSPLFRLEDAGGDVWRELMETNVIGAAMVSRAALAAPRGVHGTPPLLGLVVGGPALPGPGGLRHLEGRPARVCPWPAQ